MRWRRKAAPEAAAVDDQLPERLRRLESSLKGWSVYGTGGEDLHSLLKEAAREVERLRALDRSLVDALPDSSPVVPRGERHG